MPNVHGSTWTLARPYDNSRSRVHSTARLWAGEAVRRGPISMVRWLKTGAACERSIPSTRIRASTSRSLGGCAAETGNNRSRRTEIRVMADGRWQLQILMVRAEGVCGFCHALMPDPIELAIFERV